MSSRKASILVHNNNKINPKLKHVLLWLFALGIWPSSNLPILTCVVYLIKRYYHNLSSISITFLPTHSLKIYMEMLSEFYK